MMSLFRIFLLSVVLLLWHNIGFALNKLPISVDSRMKTFIYSPTEVFLVKGNFDYTSVIELGDSEVIYNVDMGDSSIWSVTIDEIRENRLILKPLLAKGRTNMIVFTSLRTYVFDLLAQERVDNDMAYIVRFYYPDSSMENEAIVLDDGGNDMFDDEYYRSILTSLVMKDSEMTVDDALKALELVSNTKHVSSSEGIAFKLDANNIVKQYSDPEGDVEITPSLIYHNNSITVFKFDNKNIEQIPQVFMVRDDLTEVRLKMVWLGDHVAVNGVHDVLSFRYANKNAKVYRLE